MILELICDITYRNENVDRDDMKKKRETPPKISNT